MTSSTYTEMTTKRPGARSAIAAALALVAVVASLALASPASAGLGVEAHASCQPGYILAHAPTMTALTNQLIVNNTIIPSPLQPVGYKAHLFRLTSSGWARVMSGPLLTQSVRTFAEGQTAWYDTLSKQWVQGWTKFPIQFTGTHRIAVEYFWFTFPGTNFGYAYAYDWVDHYDMRRPLYGQTVYPACAY
jgi:hypothetical protein